MIVQRAWASLIGLASTVIGMLRLFSLVNIPFTDALIHIVTGILFIAGAWLQGGKYVRIANIFLGVVYILFGIVGNFNWPHMIAGGISILVGAAFKNQHTS